MFVASALLPGAGQYRLGANRWVAYAGVEVWAWLSYLDRTRSADRLEDRYRDLAWSVARRIGSGPRRDREFEYYEAMSQFAESGAFDADPTLDGVQPETDSSTFNGSIWQLAQDIFLPADTIAPGPAEQEAAEAFYRENAIEPAFAWSWSGNPAQQQVFRDLIRRSDEVARDARTVLGIVLVNHLVSAVDALVSARLEGGGGEAPAQSRPRLRLLPYLPHARAAGPALHLSIPTR